MYVSVHALVTLVSAVVYLMVNRVHGQMLWCLQVLHGFCSHVTALKPTTLEADRKQLEQVGAGTASNDKSRLALQYRITQKELLQSCVWQYDPAQMAP